MHENIVEQHDLLYAKCTLLNTTKEREARLRETTQTTTESQTTTVLQEPNV